MQSNVVVENCGFIHIPATMSFIGNGLYYRIVDVSDRLIKGLSFIQGSGTKNPLGKFVLLRSRRKVVTVCGGRLTPYN